MYSTNNEGKSVVAERFNIILKNKIYKHVTAVSKSVYFDVLVDVVDKYNKIYHITIKMKPIDVKLNSYVEYNVDSNEKDPKFKVVDLVRISKNWSDEFLVISKIKNTVAWAHVISDLNGEEIIRIFYEKELQKKNQ